MTDTYESQYYKNASKKERLACHLYEDGEQTVKELANILYEDDEVKNPEQGIRRLYQLLEKDGWIQKNKTVSPMKIGLQEKAQEKVKNILDFDKEHQQAIQEPVQPRTDDLIEAWFDFFDYHSYDEKVAQLQMQDKESIEIKLSNVGIHNTWLLKQVLDDAEPTIEAAKQALTKNYEAYKEEKHTVRIVDKKEFAKKRLGDFRTKDIGSLVTFDCVIQACSQVKSIKQKTLYSCPRCQTQQQRSHTKGRESKPNKCGQCGWRGSFETQKHWMRDELRIKAGELHEGINREAEEKLVLFTGSHTQITHLRQPGARVRITGFLTTKDVDNSVEAKQYVQGLSVETLEQDYSDIEITEEDQKRIQQISENQPLKYFISQAYPDIHGWQYIKESLILQAFGSPAKENTGRRERGDIHILLVGDKGTAKTTLMEATKPLYLKAASSSGTSSSGVGLIGSTEKDEDLGKWVLKGGVLSKNTDGLVCVDEFDKMQEEDRSKMHEAMEKQVVNVHKASIHKPVKTKCSILASMNPKHTTFDTSTDLYKQINLKDTIIDRFDAVWTLIDKQEEDRDKKIAKQIIANEDTERDYEILRKYITHAKQNHDPYIPEKIQDEIVEYYAELRKLFRETGNMIAARHVSRIKRFSKAHARMRLSDKVHMVDVLKAMELTKQSLSQFYDDFEQRFQQTKEIQIENNGNQKTGDSPIAYIEKHGDGEGLVAVEDFVQRYSENLLAKLKDSGELYEPRSGYVGLNR